MSSIKNNLTYIWRKNKKEWGSAKGATVIMMLFFFSYIEEDSVFAFADHYSAKIVPAMLPYLFSDQTFVIIFSILVLYFFSDVPYLNRGSFFTLLRLGRGKWAIWQMIRILFGGILFMLIELTISSGLCIGRIDWSNNWGAVWNTASLSSTNYDVMISRNIIAIYTPISATIRILLVGTLVVSFIGFMQFLLSIWLNRTSAMVIMSIICMGPIIANYWTSKNIYYISPISWIGIIEHSNIYLTPGPDTQYMFIVLLLLLSISAFGIYMKMLTINLYENEED